MIEAGKGERRWPRAGVRPVSWGHIRCGGGTRFVLRPLGNRGRMGALVFLSGRFRAHRLNTLSSNLQPIFLPAQQVMSMLATYHSVARGEDSDAALTTPDQKLLPRR
jgi:hypothetical protein